jgi:dTDP-4-dehydrorhamnose 3,5-epimerase
MKIHNLNDPQLFKSRSYKDDRGYFFPIELDPMWIQSNISISNIWAFRGMHHQRGESAQSKLLTVVRGEIVDFIVDLRPTNFGKVYRYDLFAGDSLFVPKGFAHGFISLKDKTTIQYLVDNKYSPKDEISFKWSSFPEIKRWIESKIWPDYLVMSQKDRDGISLSEEYMEIGVEV